MLPPNEILKKIDEYIAKIDEQNKQEIRFSDSEKILVFIDEEKKLNTFIIEFIRYAFLDGENKLKKYENARRSETYPFGDILSSTKERLNVMKTQLLTFKEEVELRKKEYQTIYEKEKTERETGRREAVVKQKEAGASIEIIERFRQELKRKEKIEEEHRKEIDDDLSEIKNRLDGIEKFIKKKFPIRSRLQDLHK